MLPESRKQNLKLTKAAEVREGTFLNPPRFRVQELVIRALCTVIELNQLRFDQEISNQLANWILQKLVSGQLANQFLTHLLIRFMCF
ncbi:hypothetical protein E3N88_06879 [Mikania micrantha]|uniref:Uncharacterized protein n=1 Tax=Mikania micrantha TaxID=192012 RepID=A0A5N6PPY1_9ASTR|nr:hypothetical protein E3N88_06879 [Mikania micrantha]